jgi:nitrate/nitrite transporter NarK
VFFFLLTIVSQTGSSSVFKFLNSAGTPPLDYGAPGWGIPGIGGIGGIALPRAFPIAFTPFSISPASLMLPCKSEAVFIIFLVYNIQIIINAITHH